MKSRLRLYPLLSFVAVGLLLAACNNATKNAPAPPTAFGVWRFTASGALDTSFPGGTAAPKGFTFTDVTPGGFSFALAAAVQPADNKIVVAGSAGLPGQGRVALVRYNADGTLDTTGFGTSGTGGIVLTVLPSPASASAVAVQPDGKLVVAALSFALSSSITSIAVLRYNADGTLDTGFGTAGVVDDATIGLGLSSDSCALALQTDGKIVVAGASQNGNVVVFRYNTDGSADAAFGTDTGGGSTTTSLGGGTVAMSPGVGLLSDGSIVVVTGNSNDQVILHYSTGGILDTAFGGTTNGIVVTDIGGGQNFANAVAVQSDDKLVVVGHANVSANTSDISLARYNGNGTLDTAFGGGAGFVVTDLGGFDNAFSVALQDPAAANTNILVSGNKVGGGGSSQAAVLRYGTAGNVDTSFSPVTGVIPPVLGPSIVASGNVVLQTTSGVIMAGFD